MVNARKVIYETRISQIVRLSREIGWIRETDDSHTSSLCHELEELDLSNLHSLQRELERQLTKSRASNGR